MPIFDDRALHHVVARTLADAPAIPEGAHGVFLTVANQDSIKAVIAVRAGETWTIGAFVDVQRNPAVTVSYGVTITGTF